jgi:hypothetical protein
VSEAQLACIGESSSQHGVHEEGVEEEPQEDLKNDDVPIQRTVEEVFIVRELLPRVFN